VESGVGGDVVGAWEEGADSTESEGGDGALGEWSNGFGSASFISHFQYPSFTPRFSRIDHYPTHPQKLAKLIVTKLYGEQDLHRPIGMTPRIPQLGPHLCQQNFQFI
jgi:hypothetical protein